MGIKINKNNENALFYDDNINNFFKLTPIAKMCNANKRMTIAQK